MNTISPGHIETRLTKEAQETGLVDEWAKQNMLGRISQVEEYRAPVLFLLGDGSSYMTGAVCVIISHISKNLTDYMKQDLRVDGGHCAW